MLLPNICKHFFELGKCLLAETDIDKLLNSAMDSVIQLSGAERGLIILFDDDGSILFQTARSLEQQDLDHPEFEISRTIIEKVRSDGNPVYLQNALDDPAFNECDSVDRLHILSVICQPLKHNSQLFGVVYLDNRQVSGVFQQEACDFIQQFTNFISLAAYQALERKRLYHRVAMLEEELRIKYEFDSIIGQHPKMLEVMELVSEVADTDATVIIQGESGTGKELIARALHFNSCRKSKPFIPVNCAALPEHLLESELFGHVRGAFTGAHKDRAGWFERANGGTIFLDEVSDMSLTLQARVLRVLQAGEYSRVGSSTIQQCDVRVVAATNKNLLELVKNGQFREDVYYRLNVIDMRLPALRERISDIPLLIQHFLKIYGKKHGKENLRMTSEAEAWLMTYHFPGNVRELENIIQRTVILAKKSIIEPHHLPANLIQSEKLKSSSKTYSSFKAAKQRAIDTFERQYIIDCLKASKGYVRRAAKIADMDVKNFHNKMKKYQIDPMEFKNSNG